ncbi:lipopolysaccharide/colanic/teichoic acid biosynthesis glycosyltransferase [Actinoplanes campanulatus]|uniref:Lipopolysaccharide/colanic/teichoic acid biosynthesis glycosyltransferase n=1 Tax=Actinoplanes campanulatus TaxID=113559 RepID=A0A7W5AGI6_9ACTN|nr:sugar transferase [Actinoplanes campanulatus]MBB3095670.1 lipopolysaccharide/colanic/teichoic acid biosynthesis glycosyltransferase [Actinoplanes campanulatus]GGN10656.1 UDP-phosphate galactose phosphotransferase [Actinoplanes campanulatus]GID36564.1 UDP-phosphate galactose phosphotransferase [Actinoplanes campanulatus]
MAQRVIDIGVSATALVVTAPVMAGVAAAVAANLGRPVLFRQRRPGLHGHPFTLVKFRTMRDVDERRGLVTDADRLTGLGRALRSTSLDELPTLWNVLRGDMSLVGPRPLLMQYLDLYSPDQARRHLVRPGVTGLAQVSGRNLLDWEERLALDVWYVDHRSLALNAKICLRTVLTLFRREGISAPGEATMSLFTGSPRVVAEADGDA